MDRIWLHHDPILIAHFRTYIESKNLQDFIEVLHSSFLNYYMYDDKTKKKLILDLAISQKKRINYNTWQLFAELIKRTFEEENPYKIII